MKTRSWFGFIVAFDLLLAAGAAFGQTAPSTPAFEVATVRPSPPDYMAREAELIAAGRMQKYGAHVEGSQAEYTYMSLTELISIAYKVKPFQIAGPPWLATGRFDIVAKMPEGASKDDAPRMLQALLEERFKLAAHLDKRERPVLALVVAKDGPKLKEAPVAQPIDENAPLKPGERQLKSQDGPVRITKNADGSSTTNMGAKGTFTMRIDMQAQIVTLASSLTSMAEFADMLARALQTAGGGDRQVVDMTGLKGNYQVALDISFADWHLPSPPGGGGAAGASPASAASAPVGGSSIFASVKKLGLRLEPRKAAVEQLVIDHVEKTPTEN